MPEWALIVLCTSILGLQTWILLEIVKLKISFGITNLRFGRIESDAESEKGTRRRIHIEFAKRLRTIEYKLNVVPSDDAPVD